MKQDSTSDSPKILLDAKIGLIFMSGTSLPENVNDVFNPVIAWLEEYSTQPHPQTVIDFQFEYLNTASSHMIMRIVEKCMKLHKICDSFIFKWGYQTGDYDMRDFGYEIIEEFNIPISIVALDGL